MSRTSTESNGRDDVGVGSKILPRFEAVCWKGGVGASQGVRKYGAGGLLRVPIGTKRGYG